MKHLYLTLSLFIALMIGTNLNAQTSIIEEDFMDLSSLPSGFFAVPSDATPVVEAGNVKLESGQGVSVYIGSVTDSVKFDIQFHPATKWTQRALFTAKNVGGDTLSQMVFDYSGSGGLYMLKKGYGPFSTGPLAKDSSDVAQIFGGGVYKIDGAWNQDGLMSKFSYTIDAANGMARGYFKDTLRAESELKASAGSIIELCMYTFNGNGLAIWLDSLVATGSGTHLMTIPIPDYFETLSGNVNMEVSSSFNPSVSSFAPVFSENLNNYTMNIYDLTGKVVFSANNQYEAWSGNAAASSMYIWSVQGTTQNGVAINKSGKVILVK